MTPFLFASIFVLSALLLLASILALLRHALRRPSSYRERPSLQSTAPVGEPEPVEESAVFSETAGPNAGIPVMDAQVLKHLYTSLGSQAPVVFHKLLDEFVIDTGDLLNQARSALAQGSLADLTRAVHTLKSNSATFGAMKASALAKEMEIAVKAASPDGHLSGIEPLLKALESEMALAFQALSEVRKELE